MSSHRFVRRESRDADAQAAAAASVKRYWPGRAPHWVAEDGQEEAEQFSGKPESKETAFGQAFRQEVQATTGVAPPVIVKKVCTLHLIRRVPCFSSHTPLFMPCTTFVLASRIR